MDEHGPHIVAPPPLIFGVPLAVGSLLDRLAPLPDLPRSARVLGVPATAAGVGLVAWFLRTLHAADTPVDPRYKPRALATDGPYQHTRNPGYLGVALVYTGLSLLTNRRWPLVLLPAVLAVIDRGVIEREEQLLEQLFGAEYEDYRGRVSRWIGR